MQVETLGIARSLGWKVHMRCAHGPRDGMKRVRECVYRKQLDIDTLVCTRGPNAVAPRIASHVSGLRQPPSNRCFRTAEQPPGRELVRGNRDGQCDLLCRARL